jgi:hypothetical protein
MKIYWPNVAALFFATFIVVVALRHRREIGRFLDTLNHLGPQHPPDERMVGFIAFGVILVTLVALVKLLTRKN